MLPLDPHELHTTYSTNHLVGSDDVLMSNFGVRSYIRVLVELGHLGSMMVRWVMTLTQSKQQPLSMKASAENVLFICFIIQT